MPVVVHHLSNSRSQRVLWLLEELGVDYEVKRYERDPETMLAPPALGAVHPLGLSPVMVIDGQMLAETGPIVSYLIANYGQGRLIPPVGSPQRLRYIFYRHHADGTALPLLERDDGDAQIAKLIAFWTSELEKSRYFAGEELTAADVVMSFPLEVAATWVQLPPRITEYLEDIHGRPAYRRALQRGGPYALVRG